MESQNQNQNQSFGCELAFVEQSSWAFQDYLKRIKVSCRAQTLADLAAAQVERTVRAALMQSVILSPKQILRYGQNGRLKYREVDALAFDESGVTLYEVKLTDDWKYAATGLEQLRSIARTLRSMGYSGRIRLRLIVVSDKAKATAGLAQETWLGDTRLEEAVVRIPITVLASHAEEAGISLPHSWSDPRSRYASKAFDYRPRRRAVLA